jgi:hypothetical protein
VLRISAKVKTVPLHDRRGTEGKWRHTDTQHRPRVWTGIEWSTPRPGRFTPGKETRCPLYNRLGPVWTGPENLAPHEGSKRGPPNPLSSRYTVYAIPVPLIDVTSTVELGYDVIERTGWIVSVINECRSKRGIWKKWGKYISTQNTGLQAYYTRRPLVLLPRHGTYPNFPFQPLRWDGKVRSTV